MTWKPHATVAAIVERDGKFLMVEENVEGEIVYNQPAGHLDPHENLIDAVIRETQEETGWKFTPEALLGIYLWPQPNTDRTFLRFAFCGSCSDHQPEQELDEGILQALWMTREELQNSKKLRSPMVLQNIEDYLSGQHYPLDILATVDYER
ncbi:MAG: NUDIX hydrolase [Gammaproteobacteria bacterium]|nr:NUDIX hydrolase [Gammaproteobacteria bacterium]MCW8922368.1 NUDIX hydrolase [Gammaproteobacteria bacterium]